MNQRKVKSKTMKVDDCSRMLPKKKTKIYTKTKDPNALKELNPIMKEMNKFRNEVIGPVVDKAPN